MKKTRQQQLRKPQWYKMTSFFNGEAREIVKVNGESVVLSGWVPPDDDLGVCLVPASITHEQGMALRKILEANFKAPMLLLTNNVQLAKLKPITPNEADQLMAADKHDILHMDQSFSHGKAKSSKGPCF